MEDPGGTLKQVATDLDAGVRGLLGLPAQLQRIASFEGPLSEISRVVPALEQQLAELGTTLDGIARVAPALERLATLDNVLEELIEVMKPLSTLSELVPTLASLDASIGALEVTIGSVSETLAPLQSTTERVGRVVDRFSNKRASGSTVPSAPPTPDA